MKNWISHNFINLMILVFGLILVLRNCKDVNSNIIHSDTVVNKTIEIHYGDTTIVNPIVRDSVVKVFNTKTIENRSDSQLITMIKNLQEELLKVKKYSDTFAVDTIGKAYLVQEVNQNRITKQNIKYDLKIPKVDSIITERIPHKNIWLMGGSIEGNKQSITRQINADLLLITKKDRGYKIGTGIDINGNVVYRFGLYWKL